jgi:hypothetical protein
MSGSNAWAEFAGLFQATRRAALDHERSKTELKALVPEDARKPQVMASAPNARSQGHQL